MSAFESLQFGFGRRLPMLLQTETAECGLACLAMVASYHGLVTDIASLRPRLSVSLKGVTLKQLMEFAGTLNMAGRPLRLELEDLNQLQTPCILHWDLSHFVVLKRVTARWVYIHDPAFGVRKLRHAEVSQHFTGVALELSPTADFEPREERQDVSLRQMIGRVVGLKRSVLQVMALSLVLEVVAVVLPFFQQWVIDGVVVQNDRDLLKVLAIGFFLVILIQLSVTALRSWMVIYFSTQLNLQWVSSVLTRLFRLPMDYFGKRHLGDVISRFGAVQSIRQTLTSAALNSALDGLMAIVALGMMVFYSVKLAAITLVALALYVLVRLMSYQPLQTVTEEQVIHAAKQESHLLESVRGVQTIKLFNREDERRSQWLNLLVNTTNRELANQRLQTLFQTSNGLIFGIENILVVYISALLVMDRQFSVGMMFAYASYKLQFSGRVSGLVDLVFQIRMLRIQRARLADIVLTPPEPQAGSQIMPGEGIPGLELRNLRFRYGHNEPWVIDGVNLHIHPGESVAIVGPSGCGKTTLLKLMLGLLQPSSGEILIDGRPLHAIGLRAWRECLGAVMQDDQLFAGTIAENITFFAPDADMARVEACAERAAVLQDIMAMPMAWKTLIGDMGAALSGGQKQRILLARALYKQPKILFLDEATSHLDVERERTVNASVRALALTKVVIAHRPETIASADRVITLDAGRVVSEPQSLSLVS